MAKVGGINTLELAEQAVTTSKLADLVVTTAKLADLGVTTAKLALLSVTNAVLGLLSVATGNLQDLAVTTGKIADAAVTALKVSAQESWIAPTLLNSWVNFGSGYMNAGYMKDHLGFVCVRGVVKSGTVGAAIFTLPSGYRPSAIVNFASWAGGGGVLEVDTSGNVKLIVGANSDCSLNTIRFDTR